MNVVPLMKRYFIYHLINTNFPLLLLIISWRFLPNSHRNVNLFEKSYSAFRYGCNPIYLFKKSTIDALAVHNGNVWGLSKNFQENSTLLTFFTTNEWWIIVRKSFWIRFRLQTKPRSVKLWLSAVIVKCKSAEVTMKSIKVLQDGCFTLNQ